MALSIFGIPDSKVACQMVWVSYSSTQELGQGYDVFSFSIFLNSKRCFNLPRHFLAENSSTTFLAPREPKKAPYFFSALAVSFSETDNLIMSPLFGDVDELGLYL